MLSPHIRVDVPLSVVLANFKKDSVVKANSRMAQLPLEDSYLRKAVF